MSVTVLTAEEIESLEDKWVIPRFAFFPGGLIGMAALAFNWPNGHWGWTTAWTLMTAYCFFCWTSCFHEAAHQTITKGRGFSIWLGRFIGVMMWVPYTVYRESHIRHHAYLNKPSDWELWPYSDPTTSRTFRRVFAWFDLLFGNLAAPYVYGRIFFHKKSPLKSPEIRRVIRNEYLANLVVSGATLALIGYFGLWMEFLRCWLIPYSIAGVWQTVRKFTEHLGMASYDPLLGTRTVMGNNLVTRVCTYLNFDIFVHGPHHRHPRIAHSKLTYKMSDYVESNPDKAFPVFPTYFHAIAHTIPFLLKNPGVGMNAGAPAPDADKDSDVENFVTDVTAEVLAETDAAVTS